MVKRWRKAYASMHGEDELSKQPWFDKENEYSELFEALYDQPTQRREFIESCITGANPSWGYVYLTNLLLRLAQKSSNCTATFFSII